MYQTIYPHIYKNHYAPCPPKKGDIILSYDGRNILLKNDQTFFHYEDVPDTISFRYLFQIDETNFYLADLMFLHPLSLDIQSLRKYKPRELAFAGITGWQLYDWYRNQVFCGRCGNVMKEDTVERAMRCEKCGNIVYPRINPVVIVAIKNDEDQLLVTKYAHGYAKYALVAGFIEIGETAEEAAQREAKEETGLDITDLVYYKDQPWAWSSSLITTFVAKAHGDQKIKVDHSELKKAVWITRENKEVDPNDDASITAEMIHKYLEGNL